MVMQIILIKISIIFSIPLNQIKKKHHYLHHLQPFLVPLKFTTC